METKQLRKIKYLKEYIEDQFGLILKGELELSDEWDPEFNCTIGWRIKVKGYLDSNLFVGFDDYAIWIEKKYDLLKEKLNLLNNDENKM